ncbi:MAG: PilZ domain-containing protein [candidate division FCPU426 bacterium]
MTESKYGEVEFERRTFPRFVIHLPFRYQVDDHTRFGEGLTQDASRGGLQIYVSEKLDINQRLSLSLSLSEGKSVRTIQAHARVVWITENPPQAPKPFKAGLEFTDITPDSLEFLKWFEQLWLNQGS